MSFGFGIGDFVATLTLIKQVRQDWLDAPAEYAAIRDETKNLDNALREIDDYSTRIDLTGQQRQDLTDASVACRKVLEELSVLVQKNVALHKQSAQPTGLLRRKWRQFKLDPYEVRHLRDRMVSSIALLNTVSSSIQRHLIGDVKENVEDLRHSAEEKERDVVADWLAPSSFAEQQYDYLSQRYAGTTTWFLQEQAFVDWRRTPNTSLLCLGIPGSGKTIFSASVIDHLWSYFANENDIVVVYFYCNFKRQSEQRLGQMFASIARQLFQERPSLPEPVRKLYKQHRDRATRPSVDEIKALIPLLMHLYSRVFMVIDALDECSNDDKRLNKFIEHLFTLQAGFDGNLNLLATSRFIPEVRDIFPKTTPLMEIRARPDDIERYLEGRMSEMSSNVRRNPSLQEEIKTSIAKLVDGMFLLARLHFEALQDKTTPKAIRNALVDLPRGLQGLSKAYDDALQRIDHQQEGFRKLARAVLMWITYARTELTVRELQEAIAIQPGMGAIDYQNDLEDKDEMIGSCAGLVVLDAERRVLRLVHYTAQEYLEQVRDRWLPNSQTAFTQKCVAYLSMDVFRIELRGDSLRDICRRHAFLDYAAQMWGFHAQETEDEQVERQCLEFLNNERLLQIANRVRQIHLDDSADQSLKISVLHLPALFNLMTLSMKIIQFGAACDCADSLGRTPLSYAAEAGHGEMVKLLLQQPSVTADSRDQRGRTPLSWAAQRGSSDVVQILSERQDVDADSKDNSSRSPLAWACRAGRINCVTILLSRDDIGVNSRDIELTTPLIHAIYANRQKVAQILIERPDVDINAVNRIGLSPLNGAIALDETKVIKALLARGDVDIDIKNYYGETPLYRAAYNGNTEIIRMLIARKGVRVDMKDKSGRTPIFWACLRGHAEVLEILLAEAQMPRATVNRSPDFALPTTGDVPPKSIESPPNWEAMRADMDDALPTVAQRRLKLIIETMLPYCGTLERKLFGSTALAIAARRGYAEIVKLLLAWGADTSTQNDRGHTLVQIAVNAGHVEITQLLRAHISM